jgi:hypothetical protein
MQWLPARSIQKPSFPIREGSQDYIANMSKSGISRIRILDEMWTWGLAVINDEWLEKYCPGCKG